MGSHLRGSMGRKCVTPVVSMLILFGGVSRGQTGNGPKTAEVPQGRQAQSITSGRARLAVEPSSDGQYGIVLYARNKDRIDKTFAQPHALEIQIVEGRDVIYWLKGAYSRIEASDGRLECTGSLLTQEGEAFKFIDIYSVRDETGCFELVRKVAVQSAQYTDKGFASRFGLQAAGASTMQAYDFFAPGLWYQGNEHVRQNAMASDYTDEYFFFRETRLAAPMMMMMDRSNGTTLAIAHSRPEAHTYAGESRLERAIDRRLRFGALGVQKQSGPMLGFLYPGSEGEKNYIVRRRQPGRRWALRHHPVEPGFSHEYRLLIKLNHAPDFYQALKSTWRYFYSHYNPPIIKADLKKVYQDGIDLMAQHCRDYNGTWGIPFAIYLDGRLRDVDFYMAFVGGQVLGAYHLIHHGLAEDRPDMVKQGEAVIDFWVHRSYDGAEGPDHLPRTWYQPVKHARFRGGIWENEKFWRPGPSYLRVLSEGHLAALRSWKIMRRHNMERQAWLIWAKRFGDWLLAHQNADGSYYRSYTVDGAPAMETKHNTPHPIPFLIELYHVTDNDAYLKAAMAAGEYAWKHIHLEAAYVGGTPDNPDVTDKEATLLTLDAFMALYETTGVQKWLDAAVKAATFAETWNYIWDVPMIRGDEGTRVFDRIHTAGLSLVATGHSYADYYNAFYPDQYYKLYLFTGDRHFYDVAELLLHNTKQLLDTDGTKGYGHPGIQTEGISLAGRRGRGANVWLPWVTLAHIDPMIRLQQAFGAMDLDEIESARRKTGVHKEKPGTDADCESEE